jgi:hypothetical protein
MSSRNEYYLTPLLSGRFSVFGLKNPTNARVATVFKEEFVTFHDFLVES